jgi:membrane protein
VIVALWRALQGFAMHRGLFMAAGLSFYFLICLIPMLFLVVSLAGFALSRQAAMGAVLGQLREIVPVYQTELSETLERIIATRGVSGVVGTAILLFFATQLFGALRLVMNEVFDVKRGRGVLRGLLMDLVMTVVMGGLFLASIAITDLFFLVKAFVLTPAHMPAEWIGWMFLALALGFNVGLFFVSYRYFPNRRVHLGAALAGAVLASLLWETAKQLFRWYIVTVGVYDRVYGPLGVLVALSMFAYYTGVVVILGAEYAAALDARWRARRAAGA